VEKTTKITIRVADGTPDGEPRVVDAVVFGVWAAHAVFRLDGQRTNKWTVSHIPTGLRIPRDGYKKDALAVALRLADEVNPKTFNGVMRAKYRIAQICNERGLIP